MDTTPQHRKLTVAQWIAVPDCPFLPPHQTRRLQHSTHLYTLQDEHAHVTMATLPDGTEYKIDGHDRAAVWRDNLSDKEPECVHATVIACDDLPALRAVYARFNRS